MGHKHVTTTKEYLHSNLEKAQSVLFRTNYLTSPAEAAPTTAELIAQATEITGCGREDSSRHECYLTRSLGQFLLHYATQELACFVVGELVAEADDLRDAGRAHVFAHPFL